jgi:5,10-methenyltetrahydrofolate synthetase
MKNRLAQESSPYLVQHQDNPVDWYPWGEEALAKARTENKPILLSVGYSACHWCHVMAHECFENAEIAALMNASYVNIKVDREERPDLDRIYQGVAQAMTRGGGWPLTVFLTPDLKPFFGGTYFPPEDRYGRPGFPRVLQALADAFQKDRASIDQNARILTETIAGFEELPRGESQKSAQAPSWSDLTAVAQRVLSRVDREQGGTLGAPKFPNPMVFSFLWRLGVATGSEAMLRAVTTTLTRMASGGIYDQLGGGFHRYSVDDSWSVPHFEKMLYDNALLLKLYSEVVLTPISSLPVGFSVSEADRALYLGVISETVGYVFREMTAPEGLFYAAQDADSEGEEGKFFAWDLKDLAAILSPKEVEIFSLHYGVTAAGNFEHGKTVLFLDQSVSTIAKKIGISETQVSEVLASAKLKVFQARSKRVSPGLDDKRLTSWNALMISGLAWAAQALQTSAQGFNGNVQRCSEIQKAAEKAFQVLVEKLGASGRLLSTYQKGQAKLNGYLDDYAFSAMAALDLSRFCSDSQACERYQEQAAQWITSIFEYFSDPNGAGYYFTSSDHEKLIQRPKGLLDQAIPSGTAVALGVIRVLAELDLKGQGAALRAEFDRHLGPLFQVAQGSPFGLGEFLNVALLDLLGPVTVSGPEASSLCSFASGFQKPQVGAESSGLVLCHQQTCSLPMSREEALLWIASKSRASGVELTNEKDPSVIRKKIQERRRSLSLQDRLKRSETLTERFLEKLDWTHLKSGMKVGLSSSLPDEVQLQALNQAFAKAGCEIYFPRVRSSAVNSGIENPSASSEKILEWVHMPAQALSADASPFWQQGSFGVLEPAVERKGELLPPLDLIIVPGVAFGPKGERIGRGGGFYDRFLAQIPKALRVSLAYDFQLLPSLPQNTWDQPVHWVLSETAEVRTEFLEKLLQGVFT